MYDHVRRNYCQETRCDWMVIHKFIHTQSPGHRKSRLLRYQNPIQSHRPMLQLTRLPQASQKLKALRQFHNYGLQ